MRRRLTELLMKKHSGNISLPEQRELLQLLKNNKENEVIANEVQAFFDTPLHFDEAVSDKRTERSLGSLRKKIAADKKNGSAAVRRIHRAKTIAVAAALLIMAGVGWLVVLRSGAPAATAQNTVTSQKDSKTAVTLPDGTKVWINAGTRLTYGKSFGEETREISLEGEAYFDVAHDKSHPFIVHTQTLDVRALGTAFNVRAYDGEASTQATLVRGAIEVTLNKKNKEKITLKPNEKIVVQNYNGQNKKADSSSGAAPELVLSTVLRSPVDSGMLETQWMKNSISFDQQKLADIIPVLESWYHVKITVETPSLLQRRLSGKIENESLGETLEFFKLTLGLRYKIDRENIALYK